MSKSSAAIKMALNGAQVLELVGHVCHRVHRGRWGRDRGTGHAATASAPGEEDQAKTPGKDQCRSVTDDSFVHHRIARFDSS